VGRDSRDAGAVLAVAPEPGTAAKLTPARLQSVLGKSGRQRNIESWADRLRTLFTGDDLHRLPLLERAMGRQTPLVLQLGVACRAADDLADAAAEAFAEHPDAEILTSFPGDAGRSAAGRGRCLHRPLRWRL
jgi:hypothetical protein